MNKRSFIRPLKLTGNLEVGCAREPLCHSISATGPKQAPLITNLTCSHSQTDMGFPASTADLPPALSTMFSDTITLQMDPHSPRTPTCSCHVDLPCFSSYLKCSSWLTYSPEKTKFSPLRLSRGFTSSVKLFFASPSITSSKIFFHVNCQMQTNRTTLAL